MIAVHESNALAVLAGEGLAPDAAREVLASLAPCARFSGAPYYAPSKVHAAAKRWHKARS